MTLWYFCSQEFVKLNTAQSVPSLVQSMSQLSTANHTPLPTGMTSAVPQQQMMFGSASQTVGRAVPPTANHQPFYRPDSYSSYHNSVPLLQQGLGVNVTSIPTGMYHNDSLHYSFFTGIIHQFGLSTFLWLLILLFYLPQINKICNHMHENVNFTFKNFTDTI